MRFVRIAPDANDPDAVAERIELIHELHLRGDRCIQVHPRIQIQRHASNRLVRLSPQCALTIVQHEITNRGNLLARKRRGQLIDQAPHAREEAETALESGVRPFNLFLRRRDEHDVEAERVGAVLLESCRRDRRRFPWIST